MACRSGGCECRKFKPHQFIKSGGCIECGHSTGDHGIMEDSIARPHAVKLSTTTQQLYPRNQTLGCIADVSRSAKPSTATTDANPSKTVAQKAIGTQPRSLTRSSTYVSPVAIKKLVTDVAEDQLMEALQYVPEESRFKIRRDLIAREIFMTEQSYVKSMLYVVDAYRNPMLADSAMQKEVPKIFSCLIEILSTNKILLQNLYHKIRTWHRRATLAEEFKVLIPFLRMYSAYCASFDEAAKRVQDLQKSNTRFAQLLEDTRQKPESRGLDMRSYLIMPVQRIPRYTLLFQDFLKETEADHPDHIGIQETLDAMKDVATRINEGIREQENRNAIIEIQNSFSPPITLVESHRRFVKSGNLLKVCRKDKKMRYFILLSDLFLHCKRQSDNSLILAQKIDLKDSLFEANVVEEPLGFAIRSPLKSFIVIANDEAELTDWVAHFDRVIKALPEPQKADYSRYAPIWKPDCTADMCYNCRRGFSLTNRRHHCRRCGNIVCGDCSSKRMAIKGEPQRVCDPCYSQANKFPR